MFITNDKSIASDVDQIPSPLISVVVPVYTQRPFLRRCVESILSQSFQDFELLLVDDGSPDHCGSVCEEYAHVDARVKVIHQANAGVSKARNTGIENAKGQYLAFCDSDDWYGTDFLFRLVFEALEHSADIVSSGIVIEEGQKSSFRYCNEMVCSFKTIKERTDFLLNELLSRRINWAVYTKLFRKKLLDQYNLRFCETCKNFAEDLGFTMECLLHAESIVSKNICEYHYYIHNDSMMGQSINVLKLDEINEVSKKVGHTYLEYCANKEEKRRYALLHFLMMKDQCAKTILTENYPLLGKEFKKIQDKKWHNYWTRRLIYKPKELIDYFGNREGRRHILLCAYFLHKSWTIHKVLSYFFYKWIIK